jgi:serine kinase of HPr protein (carbohydrate metabolism regulator)
LSPVPAELILHAGLVARRLNGLWSGVLILGPSGSGKSDLAMRLIDRSWRLVADDRTLIWADAGHLFGRAPAPLAGLMESRGLGVRPSVTPALPFARISLAAECLSPDQTLERWPDMEQFEALNTTCSKLRLHPLESSAAVKLELAFATS